MESIFNEEGMPVKHRFILKAIKLRKKITKLRMESMLFCLRKLTGGYLVFLWVQVSEVKDERSEMKKARRWPENIQSERILAHVDSLETKTEGSVGHKRVHYTRRRDMMGIVSAPFWGHSLQLEKEMRNARLVSRGQGRHSLGQKVTSSVPPSKWCIQTTKACLL
uniref:Uncharacterized protein n=1 Tax=Cucumis melo TaxID=3656 RepID=A0A9I9EIF6_CUCME